MDRIDKLMTSAWAVTPSARGSLMMMVGSAIKSGRMGDLLTLIEANKPKASVANAERGMSNWDGDWQAGMGASIGILELRGFLYSWKTGDAARILKEMFADDRITGVVLVIDGPGGHIDGVDVLAGMIKEADKPVAAFVSGQACSAYYWLATACDRIVCASPLCDVGCVGVYTSFYNDKKYWESMGIDVRDIYADTSDLKNEEFRAIADNNDEQPLRDRLNKLNAAFCTSVADGLDIAYDAQLPLFRGRTYLAQEALTMGYVDEVGSLNEAIEWVIGNAEARKWM